MTINQLLYCLQFLYFQNSLNRQVCYYLHFTVGKAEAWEGALGHVDYTR